jgi:hypothetical protein
MSYDEDAQKRSLMLKQPVLCNGQQTGHPCKHYWAMLRNVNSHNPDFLRQGEKLRFCRAWGYEPLEFGEGVTELATYCTMYEPDIRREYDDDFEDYKGIAPEEMDELGLNVPAKPLPTPTSILSIGTTGTTDEVQYGETSSTDKVSIDTVLEEEEK